MHAAVGIVHTPNPQLIWMQLLLLLAITKKADTFWQTL
jgi:hypothetical protein